MEHFRRELCARERLPHETAWRELLARALSRAEPVPGVRAEAEGFDLAAVVAGLGITPAAQMYRGWDLPGGEVDRLAFTDLARWFEWLWYPSSDDVVIFDASLAWLPVPVAPQTAYILANLPEKVRITRADHRLYGVELPVHGWHHIHGEIHLLLTLPDGSRGYFLAGRAHARFGDCRAGRGGIEDACRCDQCGHEVRPALDHHRGSGRAADRRAARARRRRPDRGAAKAQGSCRVPRSTRLRRVVRRRPQCGHPRWQRPRLGQPTRCHRTPVHP